MPVSMRRSLRPRSVHHTRREMHGSSIDRPAPGRAAAGGRDRGVQRARRPGLQRYAIAARRQRRLGLPAHHRGAGDRPGPLHVRRPAAARTWVGFEFEYRGVRDGQALHCTGRTSEPVTDGNPGGIVGENVGSTPYGITLDPGDGHYFPQYVLYRMHDSVDGEDMRQTTSCSANGRVPFEREFVFRAAALSRGSGPAAPARRLVPAASPTRLSAAATQRSVPVSAAPLPARVAPPMRSVRGASGCRS